MNTYQMKAELRHNCFKIFYTEQIEEVTGVYNKTLIL